MAENTAIEWADDTFNPWEGCQSTGSPACDGCYAEARNARFNGGVAVNWGPRAPRRRTTAAYWSRPPKWNADQGEKILNAKLFGDPLPPPRFVFCASLADVFDNAVPAEWRRDLFDLIRATPHLTWLLLTKRPQNIVKMFRETIGDNEPGVLYPESHWPRNAAIGCTVVTQAEADRDIPHLLRAAHVLDPAFTFVSMEPLVERINLTWIDITPPGSATTHINALMGWGAPENRKRIDWVIAGGMSGPKATPSHPDWYRSLRDQCAAAGVPFLFKQWGEWGPYRIALGPGLASPSVSAFTPPDCRPAPMHRIGKKRAGRLLDGVIHNARPDVRRAA